MGSVLWLLLIIAIGMQFWSLRGISEQAYRYLAGYCDKQGLQLLSVARTRTRPIWFRGKLTWSTEFSFEFSGNGEDKSIGSVWLKGHTVTQIDVPPYRL